MRTRGSTYLWPIIKYPAEDRRSCPVNCRNVVWGGRTALTSRPVDDPGFGGWTSSIKLISGPRQTLLNQIFMKPLLWIFPATICSDYPDFINNIPYQPFYSVV